MEIDRREHLLAGVLCGGAAANAKVGGCVVHKALKGDNDAVTETFEGVDLICIQVLISVVKRTNQHNEEEEL